MNMYNLNNEILKQKDHIKKYYQCRNMHSLILNDMINNSDFDVTNELNKNEKYLLKEIDNKKSLNIALDFINPLDTQVYIELCVYPNFPDFDCLTKIFLAKKKYRNKDKINFLKAMDNSILSFFKIVSSSYDGYVELVDLITNKTYKIIDIALSRNIDQNIIMFSRLINFEGIWFKTGLYLFRDDNKKIIKYIDKLKNKNKHNLTIILDLYNIYRKEGLNLIVNSI